MSEQTEQVELLDCPFCGAVAGDIKLGRGHGYIIGCSMCQGQQFALKREEAVRLWNSRAVPTVPVADAVRAAAEEIAKKYNLAREGWVTIGRVTIDRETETESFERTSETAIDEIERIISRYFPVDAGEQTRAELKEMRQLIQDLAGPIQHYFPVVGLGIYNLKKRVDAALTPTGESISPAPKTTEGKMSNGNVGK